MGKEVPWDANDKCDECGKLGAYDVYGDLICKDCWQAAEAKAALADFEKNGGVPLEDLQKPDWQAGRGNVAAVILTHPAKAAELVCHDEQMVIWSGEIVGRLSMEGWLRDDLSYDDGVEMHEAMKQEIKSIIEQAFTHPEAMKPNK